MAPARDHPDAAANPDVRAVAGEVTELLQQLIRNACVNDGTPESGEEVRNARLLRDYLEGVGLDFQTFEPTPGRTSLVARIEGSDPDAPTLCLMGHTDVVPANPAGWRRDPFGGELVDGEIWGRGAIDMLNLTSSMAVAVRRLAASGFRPRGTLVYLAVADEEAGGHHGAEWLLEHAADAVSADYVLTESGGWVAGSDGGPRVTLTVAEKGLSWRRLRVRGTPGHGSMPYRTDNALVKAAAVVTRLAAYRATPTVSDIWRVFVDSLAVPDDVRAALVDPARLDDALAEIADARTARLAHACTHMTMSPNVAHGGQKTNVIPDAVDIDVDIRLLPGETEEDVDRHLAAALGDLAGDVDVSVVHHAAPTQSPFATPLENTLEEVVRGYYPGATLVPRMTTGGTDARFYRQRGTVAYGFGLYTPAVPFEDFATRFHGNDERIDVDSLALTTAMWEKVVTQVLS